MPNRVPKDSLDIAGSESVDSSPVTQIDGGSLTPDQQDDGSQEVGAGRSKSGSHMYSADPELLGMEIDSSSIRKVQEEIDDANELDLVILNMMARANEVNQEQRELLMQLVMK